MTNIRRHLLLALAALTFAAGLPHGVAAQERGRVAVVERVQGSVTAAHDGRARPVRPGNPLFRHDTLLTGPDARVTARLEDGSELTLGADAAMTLDDLIAPRGRTPLGASLRLLSGAFRLVAASTGGAEVGLPVGTIGIRGTEFWGGPLDGEMDVLLLEGRIEVRNAYGVVLLDRPGAGTTISDAVSAPTAPVAWAEEKVRRAVATISYR